MIRDTSNGKSSLCKYLVCGCIRVCDCSSIKIDNDRQNQLDTDCWSPNHCRPWISSWFDNDKVGDLQSYCRKKSADDEDGGRRIFPTQAKRTQQFCEVESETITLTPASHIVVGHPSLKIYRCRLPQHLLYLLDQIVDSCTAYANASPAGWL